MGDTPAKEVLADVAGRMEKQPGTAGTDPGGEGASPPGTPEDATAQAATEEGSKRQGLIYTFPRGTEPSSPTTRASKKATTGRREAEPAQSDNESIEETTEDKTLRQFREIKRVKIVLGPTTPLFRECEGGGLLIPNPARKDGAHVGLLKPTYEFRFNHPQYEEAASEVLEDRWVYFGDSLLNRTRAEVEEMAKHFYKEWEGHLGLSAVKRAVYSELWLTTHLHNKRPPRSHCYKCRLLAELAALDGKAVAKVAVPVFGSAHEEEGIDAKAEYAKILQEEEPEESDLGSRDPEGGMTLARGVQGFDLSAFASPERRLKIGGKRTSKSSPRARAKRAKTARGRKADDQKKRDQQYRRAEARLKDALVSQALGAAQTLNACLQGIAALRGGQEDQQLDVQKVTHAGIAQLKGYLTRRAKRADQ